MKNKTIITLVLTISLLFTNFTSINCAYASNEEIIEEPSEVIETEKRMDAFNSYVFADELDTNLPKEPNEITVTPSKYVARMGEEITFHINNYQFEDMGAGIDNESLVSVKLFQKNIPSQALMDIKFPKFTIELFKDGEWINYGHESLINMRSGSYGTSGGLGIHIKEMHFNPGEEEGFVVSSKDISDGVAEFNERYNKDYEFEDMTQMLIMFERLKENGEPAYWERDNRIIQDGSMDFRYSIDDRSSEKEQIYATLQGYAAYDTYPEGKEVKYDEFVYPMNWLYYETSDISLEVVNPKTEYNPGDVVKLKVTINNTSENIQNGRLVSGLDFGKKEIVKNPTNTEDNPDIRFNLPTDVGSSGIISKVINPGESLEYETEITLPDDFTNYLNEDGDKLVLTPYLYTSNIFQKEAGGSNFGGLHPEEREYNEGIELPIKKSEHTVKFDPENGVFSDGTSEVKEIKIKVGETLTPETVTKEGYNFKYWSTDKEGKNKFDFSTPITTDITLYAIWQKDSEDSGTGWTWSGGSSTTSKEKPKTEEMLTHIAYLNGYPDNTIRPQGSITRAEVAAIFARLKVGEANIPSGSSNYSDVNSSDWFAKYIAFVTDNKIMEGYEDGSFKPNDKITRAEFTAVVSRYNSLVNVESSFEDVSGHWAEKYIGAVTSKGWISGYPDGTFKPEKDISREEVATMVNKMLDRKVDKDGLNNLSIKNFKDLDNSNWSYFDIVEASNSHKSVKRTLGDIMENWRELL